MQTAYRLEKEADLKLSTRLTFLNNNNNNNENEILNSKFKFYFSRTIFPLGLPNQFSFITTFRTKKLAKSPWNIIRLTDVQNRPQFMVTLNPRRETVEFSMTNYEGLLETVALQKSEVFIIIIVCFV